VQRVADATLSLIYHKAAYAALTRLRVLRNDKRAIFTAAAHAERAAAFLHGLQPKADTAAEPDADDYRAAA
jgi:antirestriction protein ArdC